MKSNLINKIFGFKHPLTRNQLDSTLGGDHALDFELESKLLETCFDTAAIEGFKQAGLSTSDMNQLDKKIHQQVLNADSSNGFQKWFFVCWFSLFIVLLLTPLVLDDRSNLKPELVYSDQPQNPQSSETENGHTFQEDNMSVASAGEERFTVNVAEMYSPEQAKRHSEKKNDDTPISLGSDETPRRMEIKTAEILNKRAKDLGIKKTKAKEVALSNYIFIDFRGIRAEQTLPSEVNLSGTGANLSNRETKKNDFEPSIQKTEVAYHDYLAQTAEILQRSDFKTALQRFKTILKYYPSDDNALFYGAYCLFQTGDYQESLVYLEQLTKSNYANFEEECDWYMLKCLTKLNRMLDAKRVAEKIIEQNGFYSEQARDFLTKR
jgi:tetratricopeptide (TPR) repeat protein